MSAIIRITKQFEFETAHALWNYDGKCKNIHGHSYKLFVTVIGTPETNPENPKYGMVMDFGLLKQIVNEEIVDKFDHALLVNANSPHARINKDTLQIENVHFLQYQPTCENMVVDFAEKIKKRLPENVRLYSIRLYETTNSYAEWFAQDNP